MCVFDNFLTTRVRLPPPPTCLLTSIKSNKERRYIIRWRQENQDEWMIWMSITIVSNRIMTHYFFTKWLIECKGNHTSNILLLLKNKEIMKMTFLFLLNNIIISIIFTNENIPLLLSQQILIHKTVETLY